MLLLNIRFLVVYKLTIIIIIVGSSVATSLAEGEAKPKKVGILNIHGKNFKLTSVDLKTVRPFIFKDLVLKSVEDMVNEANNAMTPAELTLDFIKREVDEMIENSKTLGNTYKKIYISVSFSFHRIVTV